MNFSNVSEIAYPEIAKKLIEYGGETPIWVFEGNLGAGKTTLIKQIIKEMGIEDPVQSPTFSIVNEYGDSVYHFDCYRIKSIDEAMDFGIEEYLDSGKYCFIEWADVIYDLLPDDLLKISINHNENNTRNIEITKQ